MTRNRSRNRAIRKRMSQTGESFTQATRAMVEEHERKFKRGEGDGGSGVRNSGGSTALQFSDADPED